ncbi:hypothetical protein D3C77_603740 [compost metagenome]
MNALIVCMIRLNKMIGLSSGSVIFINLRGAVAPSMLAASYMSGEIFFNPAKKISIDDPNCHTDSAINVPSAALGSPYQATGGMPRKMSRLFTIPCSLKMLRHIIETATLPPIIDGK